MKMGYQAESDKAAQHHDVALGKVDHLRGLVDEHETERDEPVNTSGRSTVND
jgi:hypothetical protein